MTRFLRMSAIVSVVAASAVTARGAEPSALSGVRRVVFLGDSITYAGGYIEYVEAFLRARDPRFRCEFLDLGLPSETVSGLTEPGHAGGKFPRPDLHERLDRVLKLTKPDLIVACYGMNDGIYHPFSEERFEAYQKGIRFIRERAEGVGAKVLHLTPPVFDPVPIKAQTLPAGRAEYRQPYEGYDEVLDRYAAWLVAQRAHGWEVVDLHGPLKRYLDRERKRDPRFRLADDGVHINSTGHWLIARELLQHWGVSAEAIGEGASGETVIARLPHGPEVLKLVERRQRVLKDAWLSATKHTRPGMARGVELPEAERLAGEIETKLRKLAGP
jgi:lysophospholipase L1-like esterase